MNPLFIIIDGIDSALNFFMSNMGIAVPILLYVLIETKLYMTGKEFLAVRISNWIKSKIKVWRENKHKDSNCEDHDTQTDKPSEVQG